jgi:hypothetical protein
LYQVSEAYKEAIQKNTRTVRITGTATLKGGEVIELSDDNILSGSLYVSRKCVSGNDIDVGTFYAGEMGLSVYYEDTENPYKYDGAYIELKFGIMLSDGTYEDVPLGKFRVTEISRSRFTVSLICTDDTIKFDVTADPGSEKKDEDLSPAQWINWICYKCNVASTVSEKSLADFPNAAKTFSFKGANYTDYTYRDLLQYILSIIGGFGYINREGKFAVGKIHSDVDGYSYPNDRFTSELSDFVVNVTRFTYSGASGSAVSYGDSGYAIALESNPFLENLPTGVIWAVLSSLVSYFKKITYGICEMSENGDPAVDVGDTIKYCAFPTEDGGYKTEANIIAMSIMWKYRSTSTMSSYGQSDVLRSDYSSSAKSSNAVSKAVEAIGNFKFVQCSADDYSQSTADSNTVYYVKSGSTVKQYLGSVEISGGGSSGSGGTPTETAVYLDSSPVGIMGAEALVDEIDLTDLEWEQGTILNTGDSASRTDRIRTIDYIELSAEWQSQTVYLIARTTSDTDLSCWLAYYDSDKKYISGSSTVVSGSSVQIPSDTVYVRMVAQQTSSSASISVSDLGTAKFFKYVKEV